MQEKNDNWREMRELIAATGMTHLELSKRLGLSVRTIVSLGSPHRSHGVKKLTIEALKKLGKKK